MQAQLGPSSQTLNEPEERLLLANEVLTHKSNNLQEMPMSFSAGDVVKLKSGGPSMTIEKIFLQDNTEYATCVWFDETTEKTKGFATASLEPAEPPPMKKVIGVSSTTRRR
jgi:uncharacterized protein YodC (DUF2158 family)